MAKRKRSDIVTAIGHDYLTTNIENDEFSYPQAYKDASLEFIPITNESGRQYQKLDIRFVKNNISVLVETKDDYTKHSDAEEQLSAYVQYEKKLTGNRVIAILANTHNNDIKVWREVVSVENYLENENKIRTIDEYLEFFSTKINDKKRVIDNTYRLNELLHTIGIPEIKRSQFVGTCVLALKNGLEYNIPSLTTSQINARIHDILGNLLSNSIDRAEKLTILNKDILDSQDIRNLRIEDYRKILRTVETDILPFINDKSTAGQDLLNLFFITFNKYVGKEDKNQAFTPDHITDFMSKVCGVNKNSIILDPCCGSGSFLVRAMTMALDDCSTETEQESVKKNQIFGIEKNEHIYGLATTNMLIHSDGSSNLKSASCFEMKSWIQEKRPTVILMNPPYNAQKNVVPKEYSDTWGKSKEDPSGGLYFVKYIMDCLNEINHVATMAVLLPVSCAIGGKNKVIRKMKKEILEENTLDAVFSLPTDIFHPGASASACCMVFTIGKKHTSGANTFFGYYRDDGFKKKKNLGRVEQINPLTGKGAWDEIEQTWLDLYRNRITRPGLSCTHKVSGEDEWLCEAYMETDYSTLKPEDFQNKVNQYLAYQIMRDGYDH